MKVKDTKKGTDAIFCSGCQFKINREHILMLYRKREKVPHGSHNIFAREKKTCNVAGILSDRAPI